MDVLTSPGFSAASVEAARLGLPPPPPKAIRVENNVEPTPQTSPIQRQFETLRKEVDGLVLAIHSLKEMVRAEHDSTREYMLTLANYLPKEKPATVSPKLPKKAMDMATNATDLLRGKPIMSYVKRACTESVVIVI